MFGTKRRLVMLPLLVLLTVVMTQCAAPATPAPAKVEPAAVPPTTAPPTAAPVAEPTTVPTTAPAEPTSAPTAAAEPAAGSKTAPTKTLFLDVGKQVPITYLINQSPWYGGFEKVVKLYEEQTGNTVNLDVTPYAGMLEKARNAVRGKESPYDILNIDGQNTVEMFEGGFLEALTDIDPNFKFDPEVMTFGDSMFWNEETRWRESSGKLYGFPVNGNLNLLYYRADLFEQAGLEPPETWDDVLAACEKLGKPGEFYGFVVRGERGNGIRFDWMSYMLGAGASIEKDAQHGDFTVTINSPEAKKALDFYVELAKKCGPPNSGATTQSDMIQLMTTEKALMVQMVTAAWANMDNPDTSKVVGKVNTAPVMRPADGKSVSPIGNWVSAIPKNVSAERKQAALAFVKWFLTYDAQYKFAEFGSPPVRSDVYESDLAELEKMRWMKAYLKSAPSAQQVLGYKEGPQVEAVLGLRLNQALVGEMSTAQALNTAAEEIQKIFQESGRKTGMLDKLAE